VIGFRELRQYRSSVAGRRDRDPLGSPANTAGENRKLRKELPVRAQRGRIQQIPQQPRGRQSKRMLMMFRVAASHHEEGRDDQKNASAATLTRMLQKKLKLLRGKVDEQYRPSRKRRRTACADRVVSEYVQQVGNRDQRTPSIEYDSAGGSGRRFGGIIGTRSQIGTGEFSVPSLPGAHQSRFADVTLAADFHAR